MSIKEETDKHMQESIEHLKEELKGIRTGQANPAMVENVLVEVYGSPMKIKDLATITTPEPRQLLISPYDASAKDAISKGIERANLGFRANVDGNIIRINIPQMDDNLRKEMVKLCHQKREDAKISIRNVRREANDRIKKQKSEGEISEDIQKRNEKQIQELTDKYCKVADEIAAQKEKDVSSI